MSSELNPMDKFNFLLGNWHLIYNVPKSNFSDKDYGEGLGEFKFILNNKYVQFNYAAKLKHSQNSAQGIFAWDEKSRIYRYWWFEDSGSYLTASCDFIDENTLSMNWHNTILVQSFHKVNENKVVLNMKYPSSIDKSDLILNVTLSKLKNRN